MAVVSTQRSYRLAGHMSTQVLDTDINGVVAESGIKNGFVIVFVAGSVAALAITEAEPGILEHDLDHLLGTSIGLPYGPSFGDGTPYRHHETWHDDNGASHMRALLMHHSFSIQVVDGDVQLGPWQSVVLVECDTKPRTRAIWYQVHGE